MKYRKLGSSTLTVSEVCLGTMTWGEQNTEKEAHQQLDYAVNEGINFIDTAELYSVPPKAETQGSTETILGSWLNKNAAKREGLIVASKIAGPGLPWIRDGGNVTAKTVIEAVDSSLLRLQTDYIDLYQIHWPNRTSPHFGKHWPSAINYDEMDVASLREGMVDILQGVQSCIDAGKIRYCGLSDETPWGVKEYRNLAQIHDLPQIVSIQNEFNLLHLKDSPHLIETCALEDVAYLPWSPLATGILSGKYRGGEIPKGSRWSISQRNGLFRDTPQTHSAVDAYFDISKRHGLSLAELSLAWVYQFKGVTSSIIGATSLEQLQEDIAAYKLHLSEEVIAEINAVIRRFPIPF